MSTTNIVLIVLLVLVLVGKWYINRQIAASAMRHCHEIHTAFHGSRLKLGLPTIEPKYHTGGIVRERVVIETPTLQQLRRRPLMPAAPPRPVVRNYTCQSKAVDDNFVSGVFAGHMLTGAPNFSGGSDSGCDSSSSGD